MTRLEAYNRNKLLYADAQAGMPRKELAAKYHITPRYVDKICANDGAWTRRPAPSKPFRQKRVWHVPIPRRIVSLRQGGATVQRIAYLTGLYEDMVEEILRREEA